MLPLIPILAWLAMFGGAGILWWYNQLPEHKKDEANQLLADYAVELYNKKLDELSAAEAKHVSEMARRHFDN